MAFTVGLAGTDGVGFAGLTEAGGSTTGAGAFFVGTADAGPDEVALP